MNLHSPPRDGTRSSLIAAFIFAGATFFGAPLVAAEPTGTAESHAWQSADRDGDGRLSREEYDNMSASHGAMTPPSGQGVPATEHQATVLKKFDERDGDGDGYLTGEELNVQDD